MDEVDTPPQMSGYLDRRGMFGFWARHKCTLKNNIFKIMKDDITELEVRIDATAKITLFDQNSPRFIIEIEGQEPIQLRASDNERAMAWVLALRSCSFEHPLLSIDSFHLITNIGRGFYGKVALAQKIDTGEYFAIKSIHKHRLIKSNKVHTVLTERNILSQASHPFIVSLFYAFQTKSKFYLVLEYVPGGALFFRMQQNKNGLPIDDVKLYTAEIALSLKHLHSLGIIYRDLKPENVLLDANGHVKLTDFGLSKVLHSDQLTSTFCGTDEYLSPEIVSHSSYGIAVDWWTLGILLYEMLYGKTPFYCQNNSQMFKRILESDVPFPSGGNPDAEDLILGLLDKSSATRFGFEHVKNHKFFEGLNFDDVFERRTKPNYIPPEKDPASFTNFEKEFIYGTPVDSTSVIGSVGQIKGFSFDASGALTVSSTCDTCLADFQVF
ncbi:AGC family protein kinase [Tritrichomonas foetus]|uniref:AGC family protein kinase n=1 Tax=Tritrichomonas foetus TaxID=1144522 RepID=A0A1J4JSE7_9EUKA|nr:AGC family protein kinase [Tritrichomonas foetus]|eukprot:OHT01344.1 AGC family protein kinase [Tritrichomonas foetus]